jgi:hypothetical protein
MLTAITGSWPPRGLPALEGDGVMRGVNVGVGAVRGLAELEVESCGW